MNREQIIRRLVAIDPNGLWTDHDCDCEGWPRLTLETAQQALEQLLTRNTEGGVE